MSQYLTEAEAAAMVHRSRRFLRTLRQQGRIQWIEGKGRAPLLILRESLDQYMASQIKATVPDPVFAASAESARQRAIGRQIFKTTFKRSK